MTVKLQDLIDARRLCLDTLADLDAAIAQAKHGITPREIVDYAITARTITNKAGNVLYRIEEPAPRPQDMIQFERRFTINDWHRRRRVTAAYSLHEVYRDYHDVSYSCRDVARLVRNAISRLVRAARNAVQA